MRGDRYATTRPHKTLPEVGICICLLVFALLARASLMEYTDLIDPTEARYAVVSQQMVLSGQWTTPMLPRPEGVVPYMGKPPLHFWITAALYEVFGIDEWVARLPSFLAVLGILWAIHSFIARYFTANVAFGACLIAASSVMTFFLSGASVTDVTLSFCVTWGVVFLYRFVRTGKNHEIWASTICAGLAFLCKGPVGLILIGLPLIILCLFDRSLLLLRQIPWFRAISLFLLIVAPWFILNELKTPGSLKYFFWNENLARYLLKDYGDKYGSGHVHTYGTSWLMLMAAFFPWTLTIISYATGSQRKAFRDLISGDRETRFLLAWGISTPLFFTFVRQLHGMYLLPAIPPLAMLTAVCMFRLGSAPPALCRYAWARRMSICTFTLWCILLAVGLYLKFTFTAAILGIAVIGISTVIQSFTELMHTMVGRIGNKSWMCFSTYLLMICAFTPYLNEIRSARGLLQNIVRQNTIDGVAPLTIGVHASNSYSHYWSAASWKKELGQEIDLVSVGTSNAFRTDVRRYMLRREDRKKVPRDITDYFDFESRSGNWLVYVRKKSKNRDPVVFPEHDDIAPSCYIAWTLTSNFLGSSKYGY